ncbi:MAG: hypothetical protein AAGM22_17950 [Acidobacteriota bacterium]
MAKALSRLSYIAIAGLLAAPSLAITPSDSALTDDGHLLRAVTGHYGELFAEGSATNPGIRVLALDIESAEGTERVLVPSSQTWRPESSPTVIWDSSSASTIVLWLSGTGNPGQNTIEFLTQRDGEWSTVSSGRTGDGTIVRFDEEPATFLSYDELTFESTDETRITVSRHVVHLVWREADTERLLYMPLVFIDGHYVGWSEVVTLSQVLRKANEGADPASGMSESLRNLYAVEQQGDSLLLGVADPDHDHLGVIAVELLPISLAALADEVLDAILEDQGPIDAGGLQNLAEGIAASIISVGQTVNLNPAVTEYTAIRVANWLRAADPALGREAIAQGARTQTLDVSSSVLAFTVSDPTSPQGHITELDLGEFLDTEGDDSPIGDLVRLDVRLDVPAPEFGGDDIEAIIGSRGSGLMLTWSVDEGAALAYSEFSHRNQSWSPPQQLELHEGFSREQAFELLRRRLR